MWAQEILVFTTGTRFACSVSKKMYSTCILRHSCLGTKKNYVQKVNFNKNENYFENALNSLTNYCTKREGTKSYNLQYNTLVCWGVGTNDSSTKRLMFQVSFFS